MRAGQRRPPSACVVAIGRCGAEEAAGGSGALSQRVPSCVLRLGRGSFFIWGIFGLSGSVS